MTKDPNGANQLKKEYMNDLVTKYKWIEFSVSHSTGKTMIYNCYNSENRSFLGQVKWHGGFRKYSFFAEPNIVFETQCLKDIASFLDKLMAERKL